METNFHLDNNQELKKAGEELLAAAMRYHRIYREVVGGAAVIWLMRESGECVVMTRGEYLNTLMRNIHRISQEHPPSDSPRVWFTQPE